MSTNDIQDLRSPLTLISTQCPKCFAPGVAKAGHWGLCLECGELLYCDQEGAVRIATAGDLSRLSPRARHQAKADSAQIKARRPS